MKSSVLVTPFMKERLNTIYNTDSRRISEVLPKDIRIQTTISSPPYFDMKDYGEENQIGFPMLYNDRSLAPDAGGRGNPAAQPCGKAYGTVFGVAERQNRMSAAARRPDKIAIE